MNSSVFYIHGFGSGPDSRTGAELKMFIPNLVCLTYDHTDPAGSLDKMVSEIRAESAGNDVIIIGSSLGGWYTNEISKRVICDVVLYNPATAPWNSLGKYGVSSDVLKLYSAVTINSGITISKTCRRHVILSVDDEVLDHRVALALYKDRSSVSMTTGGHRSTPENIAIIVDRVSYLDNSF